ncbi:uncharacterized protein [Acropora muricata]|uniref:uncharacterized protein n=1 Tax=Acropora muricata TaxID=159855 RepID=UPI0034E3A1AF
MQWTLYLMNSSVLPSSKPRRTYMHTSTYLLKFRNLKKIFVNALKDFIEFADGKKLHFPRWKKLGGHGPPRPLPFLRHCYISFTPWKVLNYHRNSRNLPWKSRF